MVRYLKDEDFNSLINSKILVDFYADWCGPCKIMGEALEKVDFIEVLKVNVDTFPDIAKKYGVMSIPTIIYFNDGQEIAKKIGVCSISELKEMIAK